VTVGHISAITDYASAEAIFISDKMQWTDRHKMECCIHTAIYRPSTSHFDSSQWLKWKCTQDEVQKVPRMRHWQRHQGVVNWRGGKLEGISASQQPKVWGSIMSLPEGSPAKNKFGEF